ncbi:MAG: lamin tail domain-containing protein [Saprospiraceae bacterium]|nr:lamin tail domain-containing protein [Saprospiraceae bacterium]
MKQILFNFFLLFLFPLSTFAQFQDDFSDGNFTTNPTWDGESSEFIVNASNELQLMAPAAGTSLLYTQTNIPDSSIWQLYLKMDFAPSSTNQLRYYLQSSNATLLDGEGYYLEIGEDGSNDAIKLYRQDNATARTLLLTGTAAAMAAQPAIASIKVERSAAGDWTLYADYSGGVNYVIQSTANDNTYNGGNNQYVGIYCVYTATRKDKFYFDNISVQPWLPDTTPPSIASVSIISVNQLDVYFDEALNSSSANNPSNYSVNNGIGQAIDAMLDATNPTLVHLNFFNSFVNTQSYILTASNMQDVVENTSPPLNYNFNYFVQETALPFEVLINEIMADPSPQVSLPNSEFIELYNNSNKVISLAGWKLNVGSSNQIFSDVVLLPHQYLIVCDDAQVTSYEGYGAVAALTTFPSLTNGGSTINLFDQNETLIHSVTYDISWYQDTDKDDGGWTLELSNPNKICVDPISNWRASTDVRGGTPGIQNSIFDNSVDSTPLALVSINLLNNTQLEAVFNKVVDIASAENINNYRLSTPSTNIGMPTDATVILPSQMSVVLSFAQNFSGNDSHTLKAYHISDCQNSLASDSVALSFNLPIPTLLGAVALSQTELRLFFNMNINDGVQAILNSNYVVNNGIGMPNNVAIENGDTSVVLTFITPFANGVDYQITVNNIKSFDYQTTQHNGTANFLYYLPSAVSGFDIIINEIYADPSPSLGLPNVEYLELYNRTNKIFNLKDFYLNSGGSTNYVLPEYIMLPHSYVTLFEAVEGVDVSLLKSPLDVPNMPSLSNEGASIVLYSSNNEVVDAVSYSIAWYGSTDKSDGGWSLERINPNNPCENTNNWSASENPIGGTPGEINSIANENSDVNAPKLLSAFPISNDTIRLVFDQSLDRVQATDAANYLFDESIAITSVQINSPSFTIVYLTLDTPLEAGETYHLNIKNTLTNCTGEVHFSSRSVIIAIPQAMAKKDIVINEVLFNPQVGGYDFVELYNRSTKIVNIGDLNIANNFGGNFSAKAIDNDYLLFPNEYVVLTAEPLDILSRYTVANPAALIQNDLPSFADDQGNVSIYTFDAEGEPLYVDEFNYNKSYHNILIDNEDGVSLERINPNGSTNEAGNWHSAAQSVGFATPTYQNSQFQNISGTVDDDFEFFKPIFSPDEDGYEDVLLINYELAEVGFLATVNIFDNTGRLIKKLTNNELLATSGTLKWDGTNDIGKKARIGIYIVNVQYFTPTGTVKHWQKNCVLASKL